MSTTALARHEVEQLVGLRVMLEDAVRRAAHSGRYQRATATVLLDAAVERATVIACLTKGVTVGPRDPLESLIVRLTERLDGVWRPTVLPDIRHLHRARNSAQHEGLAPDREQLPGWSSAAQSYTHSLVDAVFGVDLRRVELADAVEDPELRRYLIHASEALAAGRCAESGQASAQAFRLASTRWDRLHAARHRPDPFASHDAFDRKSHDALAKELNAVRATVAASAFSVDPAEVAWFLDALADDEELLDDDDADRMLAFAFNWVTAFELAERTWVPDRRHRHAVAQRQVRTAEGPARIGSVLSITLAHGDTVSVAFRIANVPGEDGYDKWRDALHDLLREQRGGAASPSFQTWYVNLDGTISAMYVPPADLETAVTALMAALATADRRVAQYDAAVARRVSDVAQRSLEYAAGLDSVRTQFPEWVVAVDLESDERPTEPGRTVARVLVREDVASLSLAPNGPQQHRGVNDVIRGHPMVEQCYTSGRGRTLIEPALGPQEMLEVLRFADGEVQVGLAQARTRSESGEAIIQDARLLLARLLEVDA